MTAPPTADRAEPTTSDATDATDATALTAAPRLTLAALRQLDVCGEYLRAFGRLFPPSEYPTGAPVDEATCREHAAEFDWHWAVDVLLTWEGRQEHERLVTSRAAEHRDLGFGRAQRRAAALGRLVHTRPDYRSTQLLDVTVNAQRRADERALRDLDRARRELAEAERKAAEWARLADQHRAALPALEVAAAAATARRAARLVVERAAAVRAAEEALAAARAQLTEAEAAAPPPPPPAPAPPASAEAVPAVPAEAAP